MVAATLAAQSYYISELFKHFKFYLKFRQINASVFNESLQSRLLWVLPTSSSSCVPGQLVYFRCSQADCYSLPLFFISTVLVSLSVLLLLFVLLWVDIFIDNVLYLAEPCLIPDCSTLLYLPVKNHVLAA